MQPHGITHRGNSGFLVSPSRSVLYWPGPSAFKHDLINALYLADHLVTTARVFKPFDRIHGMRQTSLLDKSHRRSRWRQARLLKTTSLLDEQDSGIHFKVPSRRGIGFGGSQGIHFNGVYRHCPIQLSELMSGPLCTLCSQAVT